MGGKPSRRKGNYAGLIVVVIVLGVIAYFVGAGAAGGWLAKNVINPVFNSGETLAEDATSDADSTDAVDSSPEETMQAINLPEASGTRIEDSISAEEIALFALQVGAFSDEENAKEASSQITARGGAGYIAYDGELYRVLVAAYTENDDADDVKTLLLNDGVNTSVFEIKSGSLGFKIGAEQAQVDAIKSCFDCVPTTVNTLQQIIFNSDSGKNVDDDITALQKEVTETTENFSAVVTSDEAAIQRLSTYMQDFCETINNIPLSSSVSGVEFSSEMKYNLISIVVDYAAFLDELQS
jgi:hypothetical protein